MHSTVTNLYNPALVETPAPPPGVLVAGHFDQGDDYATRRSAGTRDWLLAYTTAGAGRYRSGGATVFAHAGDVTLLAPGVPHDYAVPPGGRWEFFWAHFLPRPDWGPWLQLPKVGGGLRLLTVASPASRVRIAGAFARLLADAVARPMSGALAEELALNALEEVLLLCALETAVATVERRDPRIRQALAAMAENLTIAEPIAALAARVALSPSRLAHLFKAETGNSVLDTLLQMRLHQAARLLTYTTQDIGEISRAVGFRSPFYFSRQFRRRFGMSPSQYRNAASLK